MALHPAAAGVAYSPWRWQSARLAHCRPEPLDGEYYASLFVHYAPPNWPITRAFLDSQLPPNWDRDTVEERPPPPAKQAPAGKDEL